MTDLTEKQKENIIDQAIKGLVFTCKIRNINYYTLEPIHRKLLIDAYILGASTIRDFIKDQFKEGLLKKNDSYE